MTKLLIATAALLAGTAALAQTSPVAAPPAPLARPMADKVMTRGEAVAMVRDHFGRMDADRDGSISTEEVTQGRARMGEHMKARRMHRGADGAHAGRAQRDPNAAFDRLDADKNGSISRDEFASAREQRIERRVEIREKRKQAGTERPGRRAMRMHRMGGLGGSRMIVMADTNKDGRITLGEAEAMALQHFDRMDTNRDGQVTQQERRAGRPEIHKQMHQHKTTG